MATSARRGAPARTATRGAGRAAAPTIRTGYSGASGLARAKQELEEGDARRDARKAAGFMPFRFFCVPGETRQIVVVDDELQFFRFEHALQDKRSGKYDNFVPCIREHMDCPACSVDSREPYFAMYLTIIDLTPYEARNGDTVEWSKKLLVVKPMQQKKFIRLFEQHGTMRGMILDMTRDGDKDAVIGNDIAFIDFMEEDELAEYETEYVDKENKAHEIIGHEAFDYDVLFPEMTEQQIAALSGGKSGTALGSRERTRRDLDDQGDGGGRTGGRAAAPGRTAGRRAPPADDAQVTRRPARGRVQEEGDYADDQGADDGADQDAQDTQPARRSPTRGRAAAPEREDPPQRTGRTVARRVNTRDDQGADDGVDAADSPPARRAPATDSMASRRAGLRRSR